MQPRVNRVNGKKEFFRVSITEIVEFVRLHHKAEIEVVHEAEPRPRPTARPWPCLRKS